jgi:hypothetical protein
MIDARLEFESPEEIDRSVRNESTAREYNAAAHTKLTGSCFVAAGSVSGAAQLCIVDSIDPRSRCSSRYKPACAAPAICTQTVLRRSNCLQARLKRVS